MHIVYRFSEIKKLKNKYFFCWGEADHSWERDFDDVMASFNLRKQNLYFMTVLMLFIQYNDRIEVRKPFVLRSF